MKRREATSAAPIKCEVKKTVCTPDPFGALHDADDPQAPELLGLLVALGGVTVAAITVGLLWLL